MEKRQLDMLTALTVLHFPMRAYVWYSGANTFVSYSSNIVNDAQLAAYDMVYKSALEVYSPELFGYNLYDSLTLRFRETPFPPTTF